jgi:hypothetical protein
MPGLGAGGGIVRERVSLFLFLAMLLWTSTREFLRGDRVIFPIGATILLLSLISLRMADQRTVNAELNEFLSVQDVFRDNSTVLPVFFVRDGRDPAPRVLMYALGYVTARRPIVDLSSFEGAAPYFPGQFRPERNPYRRLLSPNSSFDSIPAGVEVPRYEQQNASTVDYIVTWGLAQAPAHTFNGREAQTIQQVLDTSYRLVFVSVSGERVRVYERR